MRVDKILYRLMACDVAESVLPLYELAYPKDNSPRRLLEVTVCFANGKASQVRLIEARISSWVRMRWNDKWGPTFTAALEEEKGSPDTHREAVVRLGVFNTAMAAGQAARAAARGDFRKAVWWGAKAIENDRTRRAVEMGHSGKDASAAAKLEAEQWAKHWSEAFQKALFPQDHRA
jgi:hypothetical protein